MKKWIAPLIIGLFGAVILLGLGVWQIQRLEWKENLIARTDNGLAAPPVDIETLDLTALENGAPVTLTGHFETGYTDLLSGNANGAGYRRFAPFRVDGFCVIAELGFLPEAQKDAPFELPQGEMTLRGNIVVPENTKGSYDEARNIWVGYNPEGMAELFDASPVFVALEKSPVEGLEDTPMTIDLPNNHLQYAITWFSLAAVWLAMALYWGYRRSKEEE